MLKLPAGEIERLKALRDLAVLDTAAEASFDELTKAAALACGVPIAVIGLIDENRQWYKSKIGIDATQTPRELTFCTHALLRPQELMEVVDATKDERFIQHPAVVTEPGIRFYAGAPLVDDNGHAVGTLCVADTRPRSLDPWQRELLTLLARQVMRLMKAGSSANRLLLNEQVPGSSEPLRALVAEVPTGAVLVAADGRLEINSEACAILGHPAQDLRDIDAWFRHLFGEAHESLRQRYNQDRDSGFPQPRVEWIRQRDGQRRQVEFSGVRSVHGELWLLRDVTTTMGAEERFRVLFEQSSDAHLLFDEQGIIDCNHATLAMLRCSDKSKVLSMHPAKLSPALQPDGRRSDEKCIEMDDLARKRGHHRFEWMHRRVDGSDFPVEVTLTPVTLSGTQAMLVVWHDISERKALEQQLRDSISRAEGAAHAKSDFLATMSHELRTPMNGVIGMTSLLLDTPLSDQQREFAETVRTCGDQLLALINDILDFSKIEAGHLVLEKISFSPRRLAEDTVSLLADQAEKKGLQLVCLIGAGVPAKLLGDPTRLRQVLLNLLGNAVKFTERGEVVLSLGVGTVEASPTRTQDPQHLTLDLAVRDTGIGITAMAKERLFRPFSQADSSTTRKYGGTGLGLVICQRLIQLMGGVITLDSEAGKGSTFTCRVPLGVAPDSRTEPHHAGLIGRRVLILAASASMRRSLREQCIGWGMSCVEAGEVSEITAAISGQRPDLVVIDHDLPGGGLSLAGDLRRDRQLAGVPLVLLVGSAHRGMANAAKEAGVAGFLTKPVRHAQLFDCLLVVFNQAARPAATQVLVTRHSLAEEREPRRVLVVEDNPVNRQVAVMMLSRLGCRCDIAGNGQEAIDAVAKQRYHVVFMDCQMPVMDGFAATRAIRQQEGDGHHTRIVALTANAMAGDRERCLSAGMDDYLSKPIQSREFEAAIRRGDQLVATRAPAATETQTADDFDGAVLSALMDATDLDTVQAVVEMFREEIPKALADLRAAAVNGDPVALGRTAHRLKGSSGTLGLSRVQELCGALEADGRAQRLNHAAARLPALEQALTTAMPLLAAHPRLTAL